MKLIRFLAPLLLLALPLTAAPQKMAVDTSASSVTFTASATGHSFHGSLKNWALDLTVPEGTNIPDKAVFIARIVDLTTDHKKRDSEMMDWIEPEAHPDLRFELTEIAATGDGHEAKGTLAFHGASLPITIPVSIERDGQRLTISGGVTIDHRLWGLKKIRKFGLLTVSPEVEVAFTVSGNLE